MTPDDERELEALRQQVYGPNSGVRPDSEAPRRLHELEEARRPTVQRATEVIERTPEPEPEIVQPEPPHRLETALLQLQRIPRKVVLIVLGIAAVVTVVAVALTVVPRLSSEPLLGEMEEIDRLVTDPAFVVPQIFQLGADAEAENDSFESFYGLRSIVRVGGGMFGDGSDEYCLNIFVEADITDPDSDSFSGRAVGGCAAGGFPATASLVPDTDGWPEELKDAFPDSGLFFVFDDDSGEVVVYETKL